MVQWWCGQGRNTQRTQHGMLGDAASATSGIAQGRHIAWSSRAMVESFNRAAREQGRPNRAAREQRPVCPRRLACIIRRTANNHPQHFDSSATTGHWLCDDASEGSTVVHGSEVVKPMGAVVRRGWTSTRPSSIDARRLTLVD